MSNTTVVASYDFEPHAEGDLAFKKGDHITVTERSGQSDCEWQPPPIESHHPRSMCSHLDAARSSGRPRGAPESVPLPAR